jgi:hypothetical protein
VINVLLKNLQNIPGTLFIFRNSFYFVPNPYDSFPLD